ncbi:MAG: toxic anion resistance protein [Chloroflexi bacterium]|nr:toxic anion resistance protein [Chloroflexota bacterium]
MTTDQNPGQTPEPISEIVPVSGKQPVAPQGLSDAEVHALQARAAEVVHGLVEASGSKEMAIVDSISAVGIQTQRQATGDFNLLRARVGDMLAGRGPGEQVSKDLVDLRVTLDQIDPQRITNPSILQRIAYLLPFTGGVSAVVKALERIAVRYQTVSQQVVVVEARLREGRLMLTRDNIELRKLYEQVESAQGPIQKNAYLGELVIQQLDQSLQGISDAQKRERVQEALHDVTMRVQDLRTMQEAHAQFLVSLQMTRQNNTRLGQAVDRTLTLATNMVMVGLAIQSALARQRRVQEATERTREFLGNLLVSNATTIRQHTTEIGDIYNSPVVAVDKITQAHNQLIEAINLADQLKTEGIAAARENIAKLGQLAAEMERRAVGLQAPPETRALEA